jgi:membrane carboxypeptidase/penicillin-binding protein
VIYIGNDDNSSPGRHFYPAKAAFPIWRDLHAQLPINTSNFNYDPYLQEISINQWTGQISNKHYDAQTISIFV